MNDKLIMENYLLVLKSTVEVYVHGTLESFNKDVRNHMKQSLDETLSMQADTYSLMEQNGWEQINNVNKNIINETLTKLESKN